MKRPCPTFWANRSAFVFVILATLRAPVLFLGLPDLLLVLVLLLTLTISGGLGLTVLRLGLTALFACRKIAAARLAQRG